MTKTPDPNADSASNSSASHALPRGGKNLGLRLFVHGLYISVLVFMLVFLVSNYHDLNLLMHDGRVANGSVTDKVRTYGKSDSYYLHCEFEANGQTRESSETVSRDTYRRTRIGDPITITYLPANLSLTHIGRVNQAMVDDARQTGIYVFSFLAICFGLLSFYIEYRVRRTASE